MAIDPGESGEVRLDGSTRYGIWVVGRTERLGPGEEAPQQDGKDKCVTPGGYPDVTGPDQSPVSVAVLFGTYLWSWAGERCVSYQWEFETGAAGTYQVAAPDDATLMLTKPAEPQKFIGGVGLGALALLTAIGAGAVGLGLTLGGGIWWGKRRKAARKAGLAPGAS
ncbi:MAG: hypothetical protein FWH11_15370 [Micrococcales bacterium]|nr:hypothetical protein [Micrococcales bacterium]